MHGQIILSFKKGGCVPLTMTRLLTHDDEVLGKVGNHRKYYKLTGRFNLLWNYFLKEQFFELKLQSKSHLTFIFCNSSQKRDVDFGLGRGNSGLQVTK